MTARAVELLLNLSETGNGEIFCKPHTGVGTMTIPYRLYICGVKISRICQNLVVNHINSLFLCIIFF